MVNNPDIAAALKEKEREFTYMLDTASLNRSVFYFWDCSDHKAAGYCEKLNALDFGRAVPIGLTEEIKIESWLSTYIDRMRESRSTIQHKVYCLFISSDACRFDGRVLMDKRSEFTELNYQLIYLGTELPENAPDNYFGASWIVNPNDTLAARVLLADACFADRQIAPGTWGFEIGGGWYRLRATRYSSVGDDICGQLYHRLTPIFRNESDKELQRKVHEFYSALRPRIEEVYKNCPHMKYLPLVGFREFQEMLMHRPNGGNGHSVSVADAIRVLFGKEHEEPRPEWLRRQIVQRYLTEACEKNINTYEREIRDQLLQRFTLDDLYSKAAVIFLDAANKQFMLCNMKIEQQLHDVLNKPYIIKGSNIRELWSGFGPYGSTWDRYISQYLIGAWLKEVSKYIVRLSISAKDDFSKLKRAYNDFEDYKDNIARNAVIPMQNIRSFSDLLLAISQSSALTNYSPEMIVNIRRRAAELYMQTGDDLPSERRPKIGLIVSDRLTDNTDMVYDHFEWRNIPREYMPNNIIYELRMYKERAFN